MKGETILTKKEYTKMLCQLPDALTANDVADVLRVNIKTVYKLINEGKIKSVRVGREYRIAKKALVDYIRSSEKTTGKAICVVFDNKSLKRLTEQGSCGSVAVAERHTKTN